jgi:tetratricopeptide (TPR) repeat protein
MDEERTPPGGEPADPGDREGTDEQLDRASSGSEGAEGSSDLDAGDRRRLAELAERETAYGLLQRGTALLRQRHHAQAAVVLQRAALLEPGMGSIVEALARAYYNSGQHQRAADAFEELLEIDPSAAYGHFGLGQSLKQLGRHDEARTHLRLAVALAPHSKLYRSALNRLG